MKQSGLIALAAFPHVDASEVKLRPVLLIRPASQRFDDWLVRMVSSRLHQADAEWDELILPAHADFFDSGLKAPSVFRLSRLAVMDGKLLTGSIGHIDANRLRTIKQRLGQWIAEDAV